MLSAPIPHSSLRYLFYYLLLLNSVLLLAGGWATQVWQLSIPGLPLLLISHSLLTALVFGLAGQRRSYASGYFVGLLMLSTGLLGWLLYNSGGHTNPLISLLLLPVAMSTVILYWQATVAVSVSVLGLYALLTQYFHPLSSSGLHDPFMMNLHLQGMWLTFVFSVIVLLGVVLPLLKAVQRQRELISEQRDLRSRDERLVAIATFAASAVHQLGTPLSTLAVLTEDLLETTHSSTQQDDLNLMQQQIQLCKTILQSLLRRTEDLRYQADSVLTASAWLQRLQQNFLLLHPQLDLPPLNSLMNKDLLNCSPEQLTCLLRTDATLDQAILNILDNAVRVSPTLPVLRIQADAAGLELQIQDHGPGISAAVRQQLGQPFITSKQGTGLGLFLSHAAINRLGGQLSLLANTSGTLTSVRLPWIAHA